MSETNTMIDQALSTIKETAKELPSKESKDKPETIVNRYSKRYAVTQTEYTKFLRDQGISPDVVDKLKTCEKAWNTAAAKFCGEKMSEVAPEAVKDEAFVKAGGMKSLTSCVSTTVKDGTTHVMLKAYSEGHNPKDGSETKTYGAVGIRHKITKGFDKDVLASLSSNVEELIRGKFDF